MNSILRNTGDVTTNEKLEEIFVGLKFCAVELKKKMIAQKSANIGDMLTLWGLEDSMYDYNIDNVKSLQKAIQDCKDVIVGFSKNHKVQSLSMLNINPGEDSCFLFVGIVFSIKEYIERKASRIVISLCFNDGVFYEIKSFWWTADG